jgi:hypothetical protein
VAEDPFSQSPMDSWGLWCVPMSTRKSVIAVLESGAVVRVTAANAKRLLQQGKARIVTKEPFTIRLQVAQDFHVTWTRISAGYKMNGSALSY